MNITQNTVPSVLYTLTRDDGQVLDRSDDDTPLAYMHGTGNLIPGLERALEGKAAGDELSVRIEPADGYGERNPELVVTVPRERMPPGMQLTVGQQLRAQSPQGMTVVTVAGLTDDEVQIDHNHPLAGVPLNFEVKVVDVREATAEELEHGHLHGAHGCSSANDCDNAGSCDGGGGGCDGGGGGGGGGGGCSSDGAPAGGTES